MQACVYIIGQSPYHRAVTLSDSTVGIVTPAKAEIFTASKVEQDHSATPRSETDAKPAAFSLLMCSYMLHNDAPCGRRGPNALATPPPNITAQPGIGRINLYCRARLAAASPSDSWLSFSHDHACASARPRSTSTPASTGSAAQSMATRNKNAYRMFPVKSATRPTTRGPMKDEDCCAPPKSTNNSHGLAMAKYKIHVPYR